MPSKAKSVEREAAKPLPIPKELAAHLSTLPMTGEAINPADGTIKRALIEAGLNAEPSHHVSYQQPQEHRAEGPIRISVCKAFDVPARSRDRTISTRRGRGKLQGTRLSDVL